MWIRLPAAIGRAQSCRLRSLCRRDHELARPQRRTLQPGPDSGCAHHRSARATHRQGRGRRCADLLARRERAGGANGPYLSLSHRCAAPPAPMPTSRSPTSSPKPKAIYLDKTFGWETKYDYRITSVTLVHCPGHQRGGRGRRLQATAVFTRDIYPPAQPTGLQAVFSSVGQKPFVDLTWAPNMESDLAGTTSSAASPAASREAQPATGADPVVPRRQGRARQDLSFTRFRLWT